MLHKTMIYDNRAGHWAGHERARLIIQLPPDPSAEARSKRRSRIVNCLDEFGRRKGSIAHVRPKQA